MLATAQGHRFHLKMEWLALVTLTLLAFAIPLSVTATTVLFLLSWVLILFSGNWSQRWQKIYTNPIAISFWLLFALFILGLTYSHSPVHQALKDLQKRHWLLITPFFLMILQEEVWRKRLINAFLAASILTLFFSFLKWAGVDVTNLLIHKSRSNVNVFFEHIVQNFFFSIAAFIIGYRFFYSPKWRRVNAFLFIAFTLNILFLGHGRTGYLQFSLLLFFLLFLRFQLKGLLIAMASCTLLFAAAFFISPAFHARTRAVATDTQKYQQGNSKTPIGLRIAMLKDTALLAKQHPWIGVGTGGIKASMQETLSKDTINKTGLIDYVENAFLNFFLQFGVFGLFLFIGFLVTQFAATKKLPTEYKHLMQAFLLAYVAGSLMNSFFVSFCETHLYALFTAICFSTYPLTTFKHAEHELPYETTLS